MPSYSQCGFQVLTVMVGDQHVSDVLQGSVVGLRSDVEQPAHERIDMDAVEGLGQEVLLEIGSEGPEDHLHVHLTVVEAVVAFINVHDESLVGPKEKKILKPPVPLLVTLAFSSVHLC